MTQAENTENTEAEILSEHVITGMQEKKALDIKCIDLQNIANSVCDFFIICHGQSKVQVEAIAEEVSKQVKINLGLNPWQKEGFINAEWIVIDYVDVVVHIFKEEARTFYQLEKLWSDAKIQSINS